MTATALPRLHSPPGSGRLWRSLLLAVLLHVWLVLMFGNATGPAEPGQSAWGRLSVRLLGGGEPGHESRSPPAPAPAPPRPEAVAPGGEAVSDAPPNAATPKLPDDRRPVEREEREEREDLAAPARRLAPAESTVLPLTPADVARARPAPLQTPPPELPAAVGRLEVRPETAVAPLPSTASLRTPSRAAELPAAPTELPAPVRRLEEAPTEPGLAAPLPRPAELRAAPGMQAAPVNDALPPPVRRLEAPATDGGTVQPLARPVELGSPGVAAPTPVPSAQDLPAPVRRLESVPGAVAPLPSAPSLSGAPAGVAALPEGLSTALPGQVVAPVSPAGPARGAEAGPDAAPKAAAGVPDAGARRDAAPPPSAAASAPRTPLNLSLPRGELAGRRGPGLLELLPQPPETRKSKLEKGIENAVKDDCRKAYAGTGLLAVVPLAIDAARDKGGCKW